ncbi:unnamed protein product [Arctogadus glacialis]
MGVLLCPHHVSRGRAFGLGGACEYVRHSACARGIIHRAVGGPGTPNQRHPPVTLITEVGTENHQRTQRQTPCCRSAAAIVEASIALQLISSEEDLISINEAHTPQNQRRALFHAMERGTSEAKEAFYQTLALKEPELLQVNFR